MEPALNYHQCSESLDVIPVSSFFFLIKKKRNLFPGRINDFTQLATLVNGLLAGISLHTGLLFQAGKVTGLFFFSFNTEKIFPYCSFIDKWGAQ